MGGAAFAAYIRETLAPELLPGTVIIYDNLATHRNKDAAQALKDSGCWFLYLPPYSSDLPPLVTSQCDALPGSDRDGFLKTQSTPSTDGSKGIRSDVRCPE